MYSDKGAVTAIGEQPIKGLLDISAMVRLSFCEMLTNMIWVKCIDDITNIRCSGNWMWPFKEDGEKLELYEAVSEISRFASSFGIAFDGGKDSLSMCTKTPNENIPSPGTLVVTGYASVDNVFNRVMPNFSGCNNDILFIDLGFGNMRMGGSSFCQTHKKLNFDNDDNWRECPNFSHCHISNFKKLFYKIQEYIKKGWILSGHDKSDGGLITTLSEMSLSSNIGINIHIPYHISSKNYIPFLFNEEIGLVIEIRPENKKHIINDISNLDVPIYDIGITKYDPNILILNSLDNVIYSNTIVNVREQWEETSHQIECKQANEEYIIQEREYRMDFNSIHDFYISNTEQWMNYLKYYKTNVGEFRRFKTFYKPKVGIIREQGSNGDQEMAVAFEQAGFHVIDITMTDLIEEKISLNEFKGIAFVGGFSFGDTLGSAVGWYETIKHNEYINNEFKMFYNREDTFSLGICNGCQLLIKLGWISKNIELLENNSGRFESRFSHVSVLNTTSMMLNPLERSYLGVWVAHKEGRFSLKDKSKKIDFNIALQYVDQGKNPTLHYPENPNGSLMGIAGVVSKDGRHLAIMPHPERSFLSMQTPVEMPEFIIENRRYTPWFSLFLEARRYCNNYKI